LVTFVAAINLPPNVEEVAQGRRMS